jgi:two-component system, chemotaxis family, CheB/CheR fusion protein
LRDPPFSRLDLVSCRNLLIYLESEVQKQILTMLHYAFNPGGFLFLGSAETPDAAPGLFRVVDRKARIYEAADRGREHGVSTAPALVSPFFGPRGEPRLPPRAHATGVAHRRALEELAAPSALVGPGGQILNVSETAGRYLLHPEGPLSSDITQLARPELKLDVGKGIHLAFGSAEPSLSLPIAVQFIGTPRPVMVQVRPLKRGGRSD